MVFNDTTNYNGLIQDCEDWCDLERGAISGSTALLKKFTRMINSRYDYYTMMLFRSQDTWDFDDINHTDYPIITTNLVASQQDYTIPASEELVKIKRVEVTYDGVNWYKAERLDNSQLGIATDTTSISNNFSVNSPYYDMEANALKLYPIPSSNVTSGLKVFMYRNVDAFTTADTIQVPGFDRAYHCLISMGASLDYAVQKGLQVRKDLSGLLKEKEDEFMAHYGAKERDTMQPLKPAYVNYN